MKEQDKAPVCPPMHLRVRMVWITGLGPAPSSLICRPA